MLLGSSGLAVREGVMYHRISHCRKATEPDVFIPARNQRSNKSCILWDGISEHLFGNRGLDEIRSSCLGFLSQHRPISLVQLFPAMQDHKSPTD